MFVETVSTGILFLTLFSSVSCITEHKIDASGKTIRSDTLENDKHVWKFTNLPSLETLIVFNFTRMESISVGDLKIYEDNIQPPTIPSCRVYHMKEDPSKGRCFENWKKNFGKCLLNTVTTDCDLSFTKTNQLQVLEFQYKLINCTSDIIQQTVVATTDKDAPADISTVRSSTPDDPQGKVVTTQSTDESSIVKSSATESSQELNSLDLATILPIVISVLLVIVVIIAVVYALKKNRNVSPKQEDEEKDEQRLYEEIPDIGPVTTYRGSVDPYDRLQDPGMDEDSGYAVYENNEKSNGSPVVNIIYLPTKPSSRNGNE